MEEIFDNFMWFTLGSGFTVAGAFLGVTISEIRRNRKGRQ